MAVGDQEIREVGVGLRKYRTELPNMLDDMDLTPQEFRLYAHYKRVCGAKNGVCYEKVRTTAKKCRMNKDTVTRTRRRLAELRLIECSANAYQTIDIVIVDIWAENFRKYGLEG